MKYWIFNPDNCHCDRVGRQTAVLDAGVAVQVDDNDVQVLIEGGQPKRRPIGERLVVAGLEFEREQFE